MLLDFFLLLCACVDSSPLPDCCDGSDEYGGSVVCKNRCKEEGEASRKQLKDDVTKFTEGAKIRSSLVEDTLKKKQEWINELERLQSEKEVLAEREAKLQGEL